MKKKLTITAWTRITASLLFFPLWGLGGWGFGLLAQVQLTPLSATYTASPIVNFRVSWTNQSTDNHPPKVWVIIDYDKVENNIAAHNWLPATITGATATTGTISQQSARGFFLAGAQTGFSTDVTVTLSGMPAQFNWCAYALDYPPNATINAAGGYDLHGSPPFKINNTITETSNTFGAGTCITSITDLTGNPAGIVPDPPSITLSAGSSSQTATQNTALTLKYTTANASGASLTSGNFPAGVTGSWSNNTYTISGTPTAAGTFTYTVATTNSQRCNNASKSGTITVNPAITYTGCTTASLSLGTVGFTSSTTYSRNGVTISSPVTVTYCNGRSYSSYDGGSPGNFVADCAKNTYNTSYGNWFSGCMVAQYASLLCPSPWRVPTKEDHCKIFNNADPTCATGSTSMNGIVGYAFVGYAAKAFRCCGGEIGYYWSLTSANDIYAHNMTFSVTGTSPMDLNQKSYGFGLRCVR